mgnify:CR=1 FL=1
MLGLLKKIRKIIKFGKSSSPKRYAYLYETIRDTKSSKIMEIGTWRGDRAVQMIRAAQETNKNVSYYGFDLFELMSWEIHEKEISKMPISLEEVSRKLKTTEAAIELYKGFTKDTLPSVITSLPIMDFIYIDGGHSYETIATDWHYAEKLMGPKTVVIFDDYWPDGYKGDKINGCNRIIEALDRKKFIVELLPVYDQFQKDWGILKIQFVRVRRRN